MAVVMVVQKVDQTVVPTAELRVDLMDVLTAALMVDRRAAQTAVR